MLGMDLPTPEVQAKPFGAAASFLREARAAFAAAGLEVQTTRVSGPALASLDDGFAAWAAETEQAACAAGIDYLSLGRLAAQPCGVGSVAEQTAKILAAGKIAFLSADLVEPETGLPSVAMAAACARAVRELAATTEQGFGNLRFCASAHCPPNIPFLPAAYHLGGPPRFTLAVQAADVVLEALRRPGGMAEIEDRLVEALEAAAAPVERVADELSHASGVAYGGIDLSPAPFPTDDVSIGAAIEAAGADRFGAPGTLYVAALVTRAIRRARLRRCGFSGLMLPVLEDSVLARRMAERPMTVHELLLYSAVCGTGLDTLPLPGNISEAELAGIYLDVAALSVALGGKPLTARLLPVPGATAGTATEYRFDYFSNSRVPPVAGLGAAGVLARGG
jgi:uncharacterized protein